MRARSLKPAFFLNEELAELPMATRLLFQGLWCMADREGRLEDRPKRIKAAILPYDECDADAALSELHDAGFILRYQHGECRYIQVVNFGKHQSPHIKEAASTIPAPCEHHANTVLAPPDSLNLTADSGLLTEDSGEARADALPSAPKPKKPAKTFIVTAEAMQTADVLFECPWINDEPPAIEQAVARSFDRVPEFNPRDGPLEADKFTRHHAKKPPADWYRAWLTWTKNTVEFAKRDAAQPRSISGARGDNVSAGLEALQQVGQAYRRQAG